MGMKYHRALMFTLFTTLVIFCLTFTGCGPSTTDKPSTKPTRYEQIPSNLLTKYLRDSGIGIAPGIITEDFEVGGYPVGDFITAANYVTPDTYYILVDEEWFEKEILNTLAFKSFLFKNGIQSYNELRNDCDDFARAFTFYSRIKFRTMGFLKATPAVGDLHYGTPNDNSGTELGGGHAINIVILLDKNGNKVIRFVEPQGPKFVELDEETKKYYINHMGM